MFKFLTTFLYSDDVGTTHASIRIGSLWQQRMDSMREYEIVRDGNVFATSFANSVVFSSAYDQARNYLEGLITKYRKRQVRRRLFRKRDSQRKWGLLFAKNLSGYQDPGR